MGANDKKKKSSQDIDTQSGSIAYNRLEMQVSQALHMAIELYDNLDYLLILDYYDDITLFENDSNPYSVSYYQVKTNEESISLNTAISEDWIIKLYRQLDRPDWIAKEIGLITNCPLKVTVKNRNGGRTRTISYKAEKTRFNAFNIETIEKIKSDIASKKNIKVEDVDLSKFVHMRTTLTIPSHRELVEQEMGNFLYNKFPKITVDSVKTIFSTMIELLTRKQSYELLPENAAHEVVKMHKGVLKSDFSRIIDESIMISIPTFEEITNIITFSEDEKNKAAFEYTKILTDSQTKLDSFSNIFNKVRKTINENKVQKDEQLEKYIKRICNIIQQQDENLRLIYNHIYVSVLIICVLINEMRKL
ncbi:MAG: DUF4297 domain-containing protein [Clostridia bacterium]